MVYMGSDTVKSYSKIHPVLYAIMKLFLIKNIP